MEKNHSESISQLNERIMELEHRLIQLESNLLPSSGRKAATFSAKVNVPDDSESQSISTQNEVVESRIGEYGMAWLGNFVLLFGILFLTQFLQKNNQEILSFVLGFISVGIIYLAGFTTKRAFPYMSRLFTYNGHILLYAMSLRIYLIEGSRIVENPVIGDGIVLLVLLILIYLAFRNKSQVLAVIVWTMAVITAMFSHSTHLTLTILSAITASSLLFAYRYSWWTGLIISIFLVYIGYLAWIFGNPLISGSVGVIQQHQYGHLYLFACALGFSGLAMFPKSSALQSNFITAGIILNGLGFSLILTIAVLAFFTENYFILFGLIAAFCMAYSILLQFRNTWKTIAALYAIYGFVCLSICIAGIYSFPLAFFLLSIQSLLVVSMALWFRSRYIVIMNTILYIGLLITYLATADPLVSINFAFALVALVTARIMNWKKKRLEIRTELIRNTYLIIGAVMILYSLHHAVPDQFVTLSWALAALLFFLLSVWIRNIKYRWLSIITMVITVFYLFIVDLKSISLGYRIVALLFLSIISLGISIFYTRRQRIKKNVEEN